MLLPCGHCICKQHEELHKDKTNEIFCSLCGLFHPIPFNGFVRVKQFESLLEKGIDSIDMGEEYKLARDKCQLFSDLLDHLNTFKNDPEMKIHTVISELRNKVDLRREELKNQIDKETQKLIEKLDKFEKECKSSASSSEIDCFLSLRIANWAKELNEWQQSLSTLKNDSGSLY